MLQASKYNFFYHALVSSKFEHRNDVVYYCKCPEIDCDDFHIGETDRRISEGIIDHNNRDKNSHRSQHEQNKKHAHV